MNEKQICNTSTNDNNYRLLTWDRHIHTACGGLKHVIGIPTIPLTWDSGVTVQHKNELLKLVEKG